MIRMLFLDIDGTLFSHRSHSVPRSAIEAVIQLEKKGIRCVTCTGRCLQEMRDLHIENIPFSGHVSLTGQLCFDGKFDLIWSNPIDKTDIAKLKALFEKKTIPIIMYDRESYYVNMVNRDLIEGLNDISTPLPVVREYGGEDIFQFSMYGQRDFAVQWLSGLEHSEISLWNRFAVDVINRGGGKVRGMKAMMQHFGVGQDEIMAIGDSDNDRGMLEYAAVSVCMGNGDEETKKRADYVTDDIDNDGLYKALVHFGLLGK